MNMPIAEEKDNRMFRYGFICEGSNTEMVETEYQGDVYIAMQDVFGDEDFAMDMLVWCENAKPGDRYEDEDVIVECYEDRAG